MGAPFAISSGLVNDDNAEKTLRQNLELVSHNLLNYCHAAFRGWFEAKNCTGEMVQWCLLYICSPPGLGNATAAAS